MVNDNNIISDQFTGETANDTKAAETSSDGSVQAKEESAGFRGAV